MDCNYYAELVRARLADDGYKKEKDGYGSEVYVGVNVYTEEQISNYLEGSLRRFNLLFDRSFELDDDETHQFTDLIVQGAVITGLASKALIESGRCFSYIDNGIEFKGSPEVTHTMMRQWEIENNDYWRKVEFLLRFRNY